MFNLTETIKLRDQYTNAGMITTWEGGFINSIATSGIAPRGRGVEILDNLIKRGAPQTWASWNEAAEIVKIAETCTRPDEANILRDFAIRIQQGKTLTDKQKWFLEKLKSGATRDIGSIELTEDQAELVRGLEMKMNSTSSFYWGNRPGTENRLKTIFKKFNESDKKKMDLEEWDYIRGSFKGLVAFWDNTKITHAVGTICKVSNVYTTAVMGQRGLSGACEINAMYDTLIVSDSTFDNYGRVITNILIEGKIISVCVEKLALPRKVRKKKNNS